MSFFAAPLLTSFPRLSAILDRALHHIHPLSRPDLQDIPLDKLATDMSRFRRNITERGRLQGLVHTMKESRGLEGEGEGGIRKTMGWLERSSVWMVNEGAVAVRAKVPS
jgi:hypothetical protein